jgi:hypothetical protein
VLGPLFPGVHIHLLCFDQIEGKVVVLASSGLSPRKQYIIRVGLVRLVME